MAKKEELQEFNGKRGVWRTIGGRKVFIATGQSLGEAMKESGKFDNIRRKNAERRTAEKYDRAIDEETELNKRETAKIREYREQGMSLEDATNKADKEFKNERDAIINKRAKMIDDLKKKEDIKGARGTTEEKSANNVQSVKDFRKKLRGLENYREELEIDNDVIIKTGAGSYGVRSKWDESDPMTDYSAYTYGFKEKWLIDRYKQKGLLSDEQYKISSTKKTTSNIDNQEYKNKDAYKSYREKFVRNWGEKGENDYSTTGRIYTNDEFMNHLEDANWHQERRQILDAKLTNKQLEYVKNNTNISAYEADLDEKRTNQLIKEAKIKYPKEINPTKYSVTSASISRYQNMFNEYKKLHPNTKMDLQKFARMMMDLG